MSAALEPILVVDDESSIRKLLIQTLSPRGHQCQEAGNAEQALGKLGESAFGLMLLDIKMPGKSGAELLPEILASYPDMAIIMATAVADTDIAVRCMKQGAYDYITKPFDLEEVSLSVSRALEKRRLELENRDYRQHLEDRVAEQASTIRNSFLNAIRALAFALEAKDKYTSGHSKGVADISEAIARRMHLSEETIDKIVLAGLLHDIGKIGVKEGILNKPSPLTEEERYTVRRHPEIGEGILLPVTDSEDILRIVRNHHERFDGKGYPDGLRGNQIPLGARILAVADAYEAMTSERPYRKALGNAEARAELERCRGTHFDPDIVSVFLTDMST